MNKIEVTPLGTVTPYCNGTKNCSGFLIKYNNNYFLFDAGNGITRNMNMNKELESLEIFISHLHVDHYGDLLCLAQTALVYSRLGVVKNRINVYIPDQDIIIKDGERQHIEDYNFIHSLTKEYPLNIIDYHDIDYTKEDIHITSLLVPHQVKAYAFRMDTPIGSIVYSGDTGSKNNLSEFAKNADLFICESTFLKNQIKNADSHLFTYEAAEIARKANVKKLILTHFWPETDKSLYVDEAKEIFKNTEYAEENKKIVLTNEEKY